MELRQKKALELALQEFGESWVKLGGWSMWPFIRNGDEVLLKPLAKKNMSGRIVGYFAGNQLIVHRVLREEWRENGLCFMVEGDFNPNSAVWINSCDCLGQVVRIRRNGQLLPKFFAGRLFAFPRIFSYLVKAFKKTPKAQ